MADDMLMKLKKRDDERLQIQEQRRNNAAESNVSEETSDHFSYVFSNSQKEISLLLDQCDSLDKHLLSEHFDAITAKLGLLTKYLNDSTAFLPPFEIKQAQRKLNDFSDIVKARRAFLIPKKKFAFKTRAKPAESKQKPKTEATNSATHNDDNTDVQSRAASLEKRPGFHKQTNCTLRADHALLEGNDFCLSYLTDCTVIIDGLSPEIHIESLSNCKVICKPVARAVFIENCQDCLFVVACQQLRVHASTKCQFYLHVTSNGIIEDCKEMSVAPFTWKYDGFTEDMSKAGLKLHVNNWDSINDFNWLKKDEQSPNWSIIDQSQRLNHSNITDIMS